MYVLNLKSYREQYKELVGYRKEEKSLQKYKAERDEMRVSAGLLTKAKWTLFGMDLDNEG
ncbi:hypothetical protein DMJ13_07150 [halophilic archaeon]|nr:hypothetical protein DMJ13_07150 [halophilic archaeon]